MQYKETQEGDPYRREWMVHGFEDNETACGLLMSVMLDKKIGVRREIGGWFLFMWTSNFLTQYSYGGSWR